MLSREDCFVNCPVYTLDGWFGKLIQPKMNDNFWYVRIEHEAGPFACEEEFTKPRIIGEEYIYHISKLSIVG